MYFLYFFVYEQAMDTAMNPRQACGNGVTTPGWVLRRCLNFELKLSDSSVRRKFACIQKIFT